jgi:hypothetical protein
LAKNPYFVASIVANFSSLLCFSAMGLRRERRDEWSELEGVETKMCRRGNPAC